MDPILQALMERAGVHFMGVPGGAQLQAAGVSHNFTLAMDAQPGLVTVSNSGIPAYLSNYIDPKVIEVLIAPMKAAEIVGSEVKKGDWTTNTATFTVVESTGETNSYGDYDESGKSGVNVNFPQRQSYHYQTMTQWGEKELETAGLAKINLANQLNVASVLSLNKYQNRTYFFGVAGLQCYGLLNDPNLVAAVSPGTKLAGGTTWAVATAAEVLADVKKLFKQLQVQAGGLIDLETPMTLAMSPSVNPELTKTSDYNVNVFDLVKKNFPNLSIKTAPEYSTASGELLQLIVDTWEGQRTVDLAFTEKLRAHPIITGSSSWKQKKSQGTWGAIIYRPMFIAQMLGV